MDEDGEPTAQAYLFFGAPFKKPEGWSGVYAWHDVLARARGWLPEATAEVDKSWDTFKERHGVWVESRRKIAQEPCAVRYAGSESFPSFPFVYLRRSLIVADHNSPILALPPLSSTPEQTEALIEFCRLMGISYDCGLFGWHLAAFYG